MPIGRRINKEDIGLMSQYLQCGSERNRDAWGVTNGKKLYTRNGVFKFDKNAKALDVFVGSDYIIGHNRLATQGITNQPISQKGWVIAHNGIFNDYSYGYGKKNKAKDSDTMLFLKDFVSSNKTIKEFMETVSGSYSMFLANRDTKELYYMKNNSTSFTFTLIKNIKSGEKIIIGSTAKDNITSNIPSNWELGFETYQYDLVGELSPESLTIYQITKKEGINWVDSYENKYKFENKPKIIDEENLAGDTEEDDRLNTINDKKKNVETIALLGMNKLMGNTTNNCENIIQNKNNQDFFETGSWKFRDKSSEKQHWNV